MRSICAILLGAVLSTGAAFATTTDGTYDGDRARLADFARCEAMRTAAVRAICLRRAEWDHQAPIGMNAAEYWSARSLAQRERIHREMLANERRTREQSASR